MFDMSTFTDLPGSGLSMGCRAYLVPEDVLQLGLSRSTLVWIIGILAMAEALLEGGAAWIEGSTARALLWGIGAILIFGAAVVAETNKAVEVR